MPRKKEQSDAAPKKTRSTGPTKTRTIDDSGRLRPETLQSPMIQRQLASRSPKEREYFLRKHFPQIFDTLYIEEE